MTLSETRRPSLADQVYDQLLAKILDEEYPVHSRLPAEEVLAQSFGVSRPIVRTALSRLRDDNDVLAAMENAFTVLEEAYQQNALGVEADQMFHLAVARASKNPFFSSVLASLGQQIAFGVKLSRSLTMLDVPVRQDLVLAEHRAVLEAITLKQPEVAGASMRHHITAAKDRMFVGTQES